MNQSNPEDPIEELLLSAYPNPNRTGCPGRETIEALGNLKIDRHDPVWNHIWHCSPCFAEFKAIRDLRWERQAREERIRKRNLQWSVAALVTGVLIVAAMLGTREIQRTRPEVATVTFNLYDAGTGTYRGADQGYNVQLPPLPRKLDEVHVILPRFSTAGHYTVAILRAKDPASAVALGSDSALAHDQRFELTVRLDLKDIPPGSYFLGTRRDSDESVYYYPVTVV